MNEQPRIPIEPSVPGQPHVPARPQPPIPAQPLPGGATPVQPPQVAQAKSRYEPCESCGAPMDQQQRYCVECATRRGNGANPSSRYFAAMNKRARRPIAKAGTRPPGGSRAAAVGFFALLPIAVAIGVVVGNAGNSGNGGGDEEALLQALREQGTSGATTTASTGGAAAGGKGKAKAAAAGGKAKPHETKGEQTDHGTVHEVTNFVPSKQKEEEDTAIVENNPEQVGDDYIKAQQNLPDVVVVGGDPDDAPALPTGAQP